MKSFLLMLFVLSGDVACDGGSWIFAGDGQRVVKEGGLALGRVLRGRGRRTADYFGSRQTVGEGIWLGLKAGRGAGLVGAAGPAVASNRQLAKGKSSACRPTKKCRCQLAQ